MPSNKIYHFYHLLQINHWRDLLTEHIHNMNTSGLYEDMEAMYIGCIGEDSEVEELKKIIAPYPKIQIAAHSYDHKQFEFLTLRLIESHCATLREPAYIYYSHSKGVSYAPTHEAYVGGKSWHDYMEFFCCKKYKDAIKILDFGWDAYGVKIVKRRDSPSHRTHYSGNVWIANSEYVKTLPKIQSLNLNDRFNAEMWVGENAAVLYTACQLFVDYICTTPFETLLKQGHVKTLLP